MKLLKNFLAAGSIAACSFFISSAWALSPGCLAPQTQAVNAQFNSPELQATVLRWGTGVRGRVLALRRRRQRAITAEMKATGIARGQQVVAAVEFCVDRRGLIVAKQLTRSTGFRELDTEAMTMVAQSSPFQPMPAEVQVQFLTLSVPITFRF